jgi:hypothetical protein
MTEPTHFHRLVDSSVVSVRWLDDSPVAGRFETARGAVTILHGFFTSGKSAGVEVCLVDTEASQTILLPGRGMGIWRITTAATVFGWKSPVDGPVHPALVPISDGDGLGWLEGFDELVVRCGLESNGAPDRADDGSMRYPLHGRIANLPATNLSVQVDSASGKVELIGEVIESKLFFKRLRLRSRAIFAAGSASVEIVDEVTNELSTPATAQLLYHINLGSPVLSAGARVVAPIQTLAPKDDHAAEEIDRWEQIDPPQTGYAERVYFSQLLADSDGRSAVMLQGANGQRGFGVTIDTRSLPYFVFWKNTAAESDGYVVGLEPATNLPNPRSLEAKHDRVIKLAGGQTATFRIGLHPLVSSEQVSKFAQRIEAIGSKASADIRNKPEPKWSGS